MGDTQRVGYHRVWDDDTKSHEVRYASMEKQEWKELTARAGDGRDSQMLKLWKVSSCSRVTSTS